MLSHVGMQGMQTASLNHCSRRSHAQRLLTLKYDIASGMRMQRGASVVTGEQVIFRVRRPMYLINSTIIVEDGEGNAIGEVKQRWHPWKRKYDLYFGRRQFADIEGNFLAWEFVLKDESGGEPAL